MVEKGRVGNFSLVQTHISLHQEQGLMLQVNYLKSIHIYKEKRHFLKVVLTNISQLIMNKVPTFKVFNRLLASSGEKSS